ncbi:MAG TPA: hypothetical protein VG326_14570 [Tepidisphaeraceae bacterium]|jgi:hypothetical protein|nr:hypothetical protein [Tepidisphaeraceae bacterium]
MPIAIQNLLIFLAVGGCIVYLARGAFHALHGRKSQIGGCGVCTGCSTPEKPKHPSDKIIMISTESLIRSRKNHLPRP